MKQRLLAESGLRDETFYTLMSAEASGELLMSEEIPRAWLHFTGDPWMTPEDILFDRPSSFTLNSERSRRKSRESSIDTLPPYSPTRIPLPSPKQDSDVESDTLPPPLLSPTLMKGDEVEDQHNESVKRTKRSRSSRIGIASKSKPRIVYPHHNVFPSTFGSSSARISSSQEVEHRMADLGDSHQMPKKSKVKSVQPVMGTNRDESMFSTVDSYTSFESYDAAGFGNAKKDRMPDDSPEYPLTPIELDLGALSMIATLPNPTISTPTIVRLTTGPMLISPEQSAWQRSIYLPGTIRLGSSFIPPSASTLTDMDLLQQSTTTSDDTVLDEIVEFFLSFGLSDLEPFLWSSPTEPAALAFVCSVSLRTAPTEGQTSLNLSTK